MSILKRLVKQVQLLIDGPTGSPHLTIYKAQVASLFSIIQRITGVVLFLVLAIYAIVDKYLFYGLSNYAAYKIGIGYLSIDSMLIQILVWFLIMSLNYHMLNGLKIVLVERYLGSAKYKSIVLTLGGYYILSYVFFIVILLLSSWLWVSLVYSFF